MNAAEHPNSPESISVGVIVGGPGHESKTITQNTHPTRVMNVMDAKRLKTKITFSEADARKDLKFPHCDALVIHVKIKKFNLKRVMIDNGSSSDIISYNAVSRMEMLGEIKPYMTKLFGFGGYSIFPKGKFSLPVKIGDTKHHMEILVEFVVVKEFKWYNAILGCPTICALRILTVIT